MTLMYWVLGNYCEISYIYLQINEIIYQICTHKIEIKHVVPFFVYFTGNIEKLELSIILLHMGVQGHLKMAHLHQ